MSTRENILVVRLSALGDVLFALPAVERLREARPDARLSWLVEDRCAEILESFPAVDEIIVAPRRRWNAIRRERGLSALLREVRTFGRALKQRTFDVSIDFQGNLKSGGLTRFARAPVRLGYARSETREPNWWFTNRRLDPRGRTFHRVERDILLLTHLGIAPSFRWPKLRAPTAVISGVDRVLAASSLNQTGPLCLLQPGTSTRGAHKRWALERFAQLTHRLIDDSKARVLVIWGPGEQDLAEPLAESGAVVPPEPPTLSELVELTARADLVVGSDTGPVHLAALQRTPTVVLFGPYEPRPYYPYHFPERSLFARLPCSPCRYRDCPSRDCMAHLDVDTVAAVCRTTFTGDAFATGSLSPLKTVAT